MIEEGHFADLVVLDPGRVIDRATFDAPTAPSEGIELVMVNGRIVWQHGQTTNVRSGQVLRHSPHPRMN
jgi:N-acyl-D-amino-acid deacylase